MNEDKLNSEGNSAKIDNFTEKLEQLHDRLWELYDEADELMKDQNAVNEINYISHESALAAMASVRYGLDIMISICESSLEYLGVEFEDDEENE
ncbi:MAG: hypothetical protein HF314_12805 [Ignavibacteria bacterium]|jgi:hypothetical protein|nr:hypothetical protein [Ignavibacteria bacterium]MCU7503954.1 hypothetical protein [Ignavibacteria bacterium]MCU7515825.1 hypothetical protein [Ignavibacteria bacterium]